jgi:hypothetical protein
MVSGKYRRAGAAALAKTTANSLADAAALSTWEGVQ